jgi:polyhydroxyalkanoate synthesis regulator protein
MIHGGDEIEVIDNETGEDITSIVLSQILVDDQKQLRDQPGAVPGHLLSELIQKGGDALYGALRRSVDDAQGNLAEIRENVKRWIQPPRGRDLDGSEVSRAVHQAVERVFRLIDLPTRSDLEALNKNLERLTAALHHFEERLSALEARASIPRARVE